MTEEQNPPQAQSHEAASPDTSTQQGQSSNGAAPQGQARSRRRRRKRKGAKGGAAQQPGSVQGADAAGATLPSVQASDQLTSQNSSQNGSQNSGQNGSQGGGQGQPQGRKSKKFRKKNRGGASTGGRNENPGNQINSSSGGGSRFDNGNGNGQGQGAGRRRTKQRRAPQTFVGPMDHSYRAVNGNFADSPPSTIETRGAGHRGDNYGNGNGHGGNGNGYSSYAANGNGYSPETQIERASVAPHPDAPPRIVCFIDDLFFTAKIQETARKMGIKVSFVKADKDIVAQLASDDEASRPSLIVFDLNNLNAKPLTLIPKLKAKLKKGTSIVGFLSHLQGDLKMKATEAGCDAVMPRSAFSQNLPNLLRRYGLVDELEGVEQ